MWKEADLRALYFNFAAFPLCVTYLCGALTGFALTMPLLPFGVGCILGVAWVDLLRVFICLELRMAAVLTNQEYKAELPLLLIADISQIASLSSQCCGDRVQAVLNVQVMSTTIYFVTVRLALSILGFVVSFVSVCFFFSPPLRSLQVYIAHFTAWVTRRVLHDRLALPLANLKGSETPEVTSADSNTPTSAEPGDCPVVASVVVPVDVSRQNPNTCASATFESCVIRTPEKEGVTFMAAKDRCDTPEGHGTVELTDAKGCDNCDEVVRALYEHVENGAERSQYIQRRSKYIVHVPEADLLVLMEVSRSPEMTALRRAMEKKSKCRAPRLKFFQHDGSAVECV